MMELVYIELPSRSAILFIAFVVMLVPAFFLVRWNLRRLRKRAMQQGSDRIRVVTGRGRVTLSIRLGEHPTLQQRIYYLFSIAVLYLGSVLLCGLVSGMIVLLLCPTSILQRVEADGSFDQWDDKCVFLKSCTGYLFENRSSDTVYLIYPTEAGSVALEKQIIPPNALEEIPDDLFINEYDEFFTFGTGTVELDNYTVSSRTAALVRSQSDCEKVEMK